MDKIKFDTVFDKGESQLRNIVPSKNYLISKS